jgi:ubiquinone/menaquinone biosynthesis C-methylase UbiE
MTTDLLDIGFAADLPMGTAESRLAAPTAPSLLALLGALADPSRLRIVALLRVFELAVGEIALLLEQSQPRVSRHVRLLEEANLVERRREGSWVFVRLRNDGPVQQLLGALDAVGLSAEERAVMERDRRRLGAVQAEREASAKRYFAAHAEEWDAIRSLHVAEAEVEQAILARLAGLSLGHLLDIGTGTGRMATILRGAAQRITALDRSPEMLRVARSRLVGGAVPVDLVHGDFAALPLAPASVDTVVMHQVLHYAVNPDQVLVEAARVLRPGGHILIVDFAPHEREELRREAAHARLGFSDKQMRNWFADAQLTLESTHALSPAAPDGPTLTVKLWLGKRRRAPIPLPLVQRKGLV